MCSVVLFFAAAVCIAFNFFFLKEGGVIGGYDGCHCIVLMKLVSNNRNSLGIVRMQNVICVCCNQREMGREGGVIIRYLTAKYHHLKYQILCTIIYLYIQCTFQILYFTETKNHSTSISVIRIDKYINIFINCRGEKYEFQTSGAQIVEMFSNSQIEKKNTVHKTDYWHNNLLKKAFHMHKTN